MSRQLTGKSALVTGSTSGIGKAIATLFAAEGANVMLNGFGDAGEIEALRIGAQRYLERFYGEFGFATVSEPYDEDGIMHVEMLRPASTVPDRRDRKVGQ